MTAGAAGDDAALKEAVSDYWMRHYLSDEVLLCSLCGNRGVIDTRGRAVSPAGVHVGRVDFCICPNGQAWREYGSGVSPAELMDEFAAKAESLGVAIDPQSGGAEVR